MQKSGYRSIANHYDACFSLHGDTHKGMDWPNAAEAARRYAVMLGVIREPRPHPVRVLDFGCGTGHLYQYICDHHIAGIAYSGLDISESMIRACRDKFPNVEFASGDVLTHEVPLPDVDYVIMNGVFTEKRELAWDDMFDYFARLLVRVYAHARCGIAFNVMSKQVDWEREDLFHVPLDSLASFLVGSLSRHFVIRNDYGLYEYTAYVYKEPRLVVIGEA